MRFTKFVLLAGWVLLWVLGCGGDGAPAADGAGETVPPAENQPSTGAAEETATAGTILAFGDSLTEGFGLEDPADAYPAQLEEKLRADGYEYEVINGGISGETTTAALARTDWMLNTDPDIVIVATGGNDGLRGIDLELTAANIDEIVAKFEESGAVVVFAGMQIVQNLGDTYTRRFAEIYPAVAAEHPDVIFIPFLLERVAADPDLNQPDFVHPNAAGYEKMVAHIYPYVLDAIERHRAQSGG